MNHYQYLPLHLHDKIIHVIFKKWINAVARISTGVESSLLLLFIIIIVIFYLFFIYLVVEEDR